MGSHREKPIEVALPSGRVAVVSWRPPRAKGPGRRRRRGEAFDPNAFLRRLRVVAGQIRRLGLRGFDAYALALDLLFPARGNSRPKGTSRRDLRFRIRDKLQSEQRRRRRERRVASREVPEGVWRQPLSEPEAEELREVLRGALREVARNLPKVARSSFASRVLARLKGEPVPGPSSTSRLDRKIRDALATALLREGVEVASLGACPGAGPILLKALRLWARGAVQASPSGRRRI